MASSKGSTKDQQQQPGEREQLQAQFNPSGNPRDVQLLGERAVLCPVTGQPTLISDTSDVRRRRRGSQSSGSSSSSSSGDDDNKRQPNDAPTDREHNLLLHTFPSLPPHTFTSPLLAKIDRVAIHSATALLASNTASALLALNRPASVALSLVSAGAVYVYANSAKADYSRALDLFRSETALHRAHKFAPPSPESAEWLNSLVAGVWPLIDTKLFEAVIDMVEDIMHQSMPSVINSVKISDVSQGTNPFRLVYCRRLPAKSDTSRGEGENGQQQQEQEKEKEEEEAEEGTYVNYEIEVAYHAQPGLNVKHHNIHLLLEFFMSVKDLFNIPISVWAQLESFHATLRLRLQLTESPPYIGNLMFTFMGLPAVSISVQPLNKGLPNVLDLPFLNDFVQSSIAAACNAYVAPKSMTLNIGEILMGTGTKLDTDAMGVLQVTLHRAVDLESRDADGGSDPYVVCSFASLGKALYTTRVLKNDLNPVWEETCFCLVSPDDLKAHEEFLLMLWDEDKGPSDDDLLGRIRVPLKELVNNPRQERQDSLLSLKGNKQTQGTLFWTSNFYGKADLLQPKEQSSSGTEVSREQQQEQSQESSTPSSQNAPMDPERPSGILSVSVHEVHHVERQLKPGDDPDKEDLPSPYAVVYLDGDRRFKTRTKQYSSRASFNKTEEMFVSNWQTARVKIVVHDAVPRGKDPVLGEVDVSIADFLSHGCQQTELRSLQNGIGYGRISISLLFRSIDTQLPKHFLTAERGLLSITSLSFKSEPSQQLPSTKLRLSTKYDHLKVSHKTSSESEGQTKWELSEPLKLAFKSRHRARLSIEFGRGFQIAGIGKDADGLATIQLWHLADNEALSVDVPVVVGDDLEDYQDHILSEEQTRKAQHLKVVGHLHLEMQVTPNVPAKPQGKNDSLDEPGKDDSTHARAKEDRPSTPPAASSPPERPQSPASPAGSLRQSFKSKTQRFKDMFKHSDSEGE